MTEYKKNIIKREDLKNEVITKLKCNEILTEEKKDPVFRE